MKQNKTIKLLALFTLALVGMLSFASALGVSYAYYDGHPLLLSPGESATVPVNIQNMIGDQDLTVTLKVTSGNEIASTSSSSYKIKANTANTFANVLVKVPSDVAIGTSYNVMLVLSTVNANNQGEMISVGTALETNLPITVVAPKEQPAPAYDSTTMWIITLLVILLIFWIVFKMMNKKKRR